MFCGDERRRYVAMREGKPISCVQRDYFLIEVWVRVELIQQEVAKSVTHEGGYLTPRCRAGDLFKVKVCVSYLSHTLPVKRLGRAHHRALSNVLSPQKSLQNVAYCKLTNSYCHVQRRGPVYMRCYVSHPLYQYMS